MLGAIFAGLSGMNAHSKGLQTISNNVTNMNTPGFKADTVTFSDAFSQGSGGLSYNLSSGSEQSGMGVHVAPPTIDFRQGDLRQTGNDLDLAIQGSGFLALLSGDKTFYARTGQFTIDDKGYIVQQGSGYRLAMLDGTNQLVPINVDSKRTDPPVATTKITFADNLSSTATDDTVSNIAVFDSAGGKHVWQVKFTPVGAASPGQWNVAVSDEGGNAIGSGTLKFVGGIVDPASAKIDVSTSPAGAAALAVELDFSSGVTSFSSGSVSTLRAASVDGKGPGTLTSVTIDSDGKVKLTYSNAKEDLLGPVAIADFRDPQELERIGDGLFTAKGTEQHRYVASGVEGAGKLVSGEIEASNVNLADEFGELILIQRGFQASSQVVSVSNDMIQQLFAMRGQG
jgi:flagellar hook protein FlgE